MKGQLGDSKRMNHDKMLEHIMSFGLSEMLLSLGRIWGFRCFPSLEDIKLPLAASSWHRLKTIPTSCSLLHLSMETSQLEVVDERSCFVRWRYMNTKAIKCSHFSAYKRSCSDHPSISEAQTQLRCKCVFGLTLLGEAWASWIQVKNNLWIQ